MRALVFGGPGVMTLADRDDLHDDGESIVADVVASGICGSELEAFRGVSSSRVPPLVFGHEAVVRWRGDEYIVNPLRACGHCPACGRGDVNLCENRRLLSLHEDGTNADQVRVRPAALVPLPTGLDPVSAVLAEPLATAINALAPRSGPFPESVAVIGCGTLGLLAVRAARALGAASVTATDPQQTRRKLASAEGVVTAPELPEGSRFDMVLDMVGTGRTRAAAVAHVVSGGTVRFVGLHSPAAELPMTEVITRGLRLEGVYAYRPEHLELAAQLLADQRVRVDDLITVRPLADGAAAFAELSQPTDLLKVVLVP